MEEESIARFLLLEGAVIVAGYGLASVLTKGRGDFFNRPLLTGLFATVLAHLYLAMTEGLDALFLISLVFGFLYGLAGGIVLELFRKLVTAKKNG